jgi:UDP-N-acetyl-D-galactosamine dehydrogenase
VAVGHNEYRSIELEKLKTFLKGDKPLLVDVKGLFDRKLAEQIGLTIFRL